MTAAPRIKVAGLALLVLALPVLAFLPSTSLAMDKQVRTVLTTSMYGAVGGTVLGFAVFPFTTNARHIFMGASLGMYAGIAMGVYFVVVRLQGEQFFFAPQKAGPTKSPGRRAPPSGGSEIPGSTYDAEPPVDPGYGPQFDQEAPPDTWLKRTPPYARLAPQIYIPVTVYHF